MKALLKELYFRCAHAPRLPKDRAVILMYHSVSEQQDRFFSVAPADFRKHLHYLKERAYPVVSLAELVRRLKASEPLDGAVAVTFDDGYRDNLTEVLPLLKEYDFPATIFVTTGQIDMKDECGLSHLTNEDLKALELSGLVAIEPHTMTHPKLADLSLEEAREEIIGSKEALEALLGKRCTLFAYPYGNYCPETAGLVRDSGFTAAVTVKEGTVTAGATLYELPRVSVDRSTTFAQFRGKLSTAVDRYERLKVWR